MPSLSYSILSSPSVPSIEEVESDRLGYDEPNFSLRFSLPDQLPVLDDTRRERLIAEKAHSLGLTSRDWSQTPLARRMVGGERRRMEKVMNTRPQTEGCSARKEVAEVSGRGQEDGRAGRRSRAATRQSSRTDDDPQRTQTRRHTPASKTTQAAQRGSKKMEQLKSIYTSASTSSPSHGKEREQNIERLILARPKASHRAHTRAPSRARGPITGSRPATRQRLFNPSLSVEASRAPTRMTLRDVPRELDGSVCFNELPRPVVVTPLDSPGKGKGEHDGGRTRGGRREHCHSTALAIKLRRPTRAHRRKSASPERPLPPAGSSAEQIYAHHTRLRERFQDLLGIQQPRVVSLD